jgi:hypothetical protein
MRHESQSGQCCTEEGNALIDRCPQSVTYFIVSTYNSAFRGPLAKIPGPASRHLSILPYIQDLLSGRSVNSTVALHKKYGDVVRLAPNEVSFTSGETAWPDIYGFRTGKLKGHVNMQKVRVATKYTSYTMSNLFAGSAMVWPTSERSPVHTQRQRRRSHPRFVNTIVAGIL